MISCNDATISVKLINEFIYITQNYRLQLHYKVQYIIYITQSRSQVLRLGMKSTSANNIKNTTLFMPSFNQWQYVGMPTKQKQSVMSLHWLILPADRPRDVNSGCVLNILDVPTKLTSSKSGVSPGITPQMSPQKVAPSTKKRSTYGRESIERSSSNRSVHWEEKSILSTKSTPVTRVWRLKFLLMGQSRHPVTTDTLSTRHIGIIPCKHLKSMRCGVVE